MLAFLVSTRTFVDLPGAYRFAVNRREPISNASLGDFLNVTDIHELDSDEHEEGNVSEKVGSRHERSQQRRSERILNIHHRVQERNQQGQGQDDVQERKKQEEIEESSLSPVKQEGNLESTSDRDSRPPSTTTQDSSSRNGTTAEAEAKMKEGTPLEARTSGKPPEFSGAIGGTKNGMLRGQNITRVSYTMYKIMKLFGFSSMIDSPAGAHAEWMPEVVRQMTYEVPFFQYIGVDEDNEKVQSARQSIGEAVDGEFYVMDVEEQLPNGTDVLFHWTELDGTERDARNKHYVRHIARVMKKAKDQQCGYIIMGQFPRLNGPSPAYRNGRWAFLGAEEEEPFLFNEHVRGVVPTSSGGKAYMLYLTFYSLRGIPVSALEALV